MKLFWLSIALIILVGLAFDTGAYIGNHYGTARQSTVTAVERVLVHDGYTLPARFEGQGQVVIGCGFLNPPEVHPEEPPIGGFSGGVDDQFGMFLILDGPEGPTMLTGDKCAISVDFSRFPYAPYPVPQETY